MIVKKTKKGRFSFALTYEERSDIFHALCNFLEDESVKLMGKSITTEPEIMRHLYYSTLNDMVARKDFSLQTSEDIKWTITRPEAIALMWLLRGYDYQLEMLELKSALHKQLH